MRRVEFVLEVRAREDIPARILQLMTDRIEEEIYNELEELNRALQTALDYEVKLWDIEQEKLLIERIVNLCNN